MKQPLVRARLELRAVIAAELVAVAIAIPLLLTGCGLPVAIASGAALGLLWCVLTLAGLTLWQWLRLGLRWGRHRERRVVVIDKRAQPKNQEHADVQG